MWGFVAMVFSELGFLYAFLPLNLLFYFLARDIRTKNTVMLIFSLIFYAWGEPVYLLLLLGMVVSNWLFALWIGVARAKGKPAVARLALVLTCVVDLAAIGVFKYGTFFLTNTNLLLGLPKVVPEILLPIGISFYTFQILSYVIDVYRGEIPPQRDLRTLLLYVSLFHQCIAGPIVRYQDVCEELQSRTVSWKDASDGVGRFAIGLAKKAVFANHCGLLADQLLGESGAVGTRSVAALWLGMLCYALQIYLDFSAYSDMAIGMGRMIGFHYKENFNYPYISQSVTDFWRRWHMSLSSFFRDYVYIPLGGNRCGKGRQFFNMLVVWFLTGLWHGASWNFVLWGLYFFVFLSLEKFVLAPFLEKLPRVFRHVYLLIVVFFGWVLFRMETLPDVIAAACGLFGQNGNALTDFETNALFMNNLFFLILAIVACTPLVKVLSEKLSEGAGRSPTVGVVHTVVQVVCPIVLLLIATAMLVGDSYNPFLYFQF